MKKLILFILCAPFLSIYSLYAQQSFPSDPSKAELVTEDITKFWKAYDKIKSGYKGNPFADYYIKVGSQGVQDFIPGRIQHADTLYNLVLRNPAKYADIREKSLKVTQKEKAIRASFYALKYWYPQALFPPVYFVIGAFNSGGTSSPNGLIIGAELQDPNGVPFMVAHELIHFQQKFPQRETTLLEQSILEGSADFIGELISGEDLNTAYFQYGEKHEKMLCEEFVKIMNDTKYYGWLYGSEGRKEGRPMDLGYWMGYKIAKAYFDKATNKQQAVADILNVSDFNQFLSKSGYLAKYVK